MRRVRLFSMGLAASLLLVLRAAPSFAASSSAVPAACAPQSIATKYPGLVGKTFRSSIDPAGPPFAFRDPKNMERITGLDAEYGRAVFACIGAPIEFVVGTLSGIVPALNAGQIDLTFSHFIYTPERVAQADFVLFYRVGAVMVVSKGNPKNLHSLADLCGMRGATQLGSTEVATLQRTNDACVAAHKPPVEVSLAPNRPTGLQQLQTGRIDALLGIGTAATYDQSLFEIAYSYTSPGAAGVGTRKGDRELQKAIIEAITILQGDGEEKKLYEAFGVDPNLSMPPKLAVE